MNKFTKKSISIVLVVLLLFGTTIPAFASAYTGVRYPIITVAGRTKLIDIYNAEGERVYPLDDDALSKDTLLAEVKDCLPSVAKGLVTGDYTEWVNKVVAIFDDLYGDFLPDKNGDITDGSYASLECGTSDYILTDWSKFEYAFVYDWRKDVYTVAEQLHNYIQLIKENTGAEKVQIDTRCFGASLMLTYIDMYGCDDIDTLVMQSSLALGSKIISGLFSGDLAIDLDNVQAYLNSIDDLDLGNDDLTDFIYIFLELVNSLNGLQLTEAVLNNLISMLFNEIAPEIYRHSLGRFSLYLDMVDAEHYETAKKVIFSGYEEEYAGLIEKADKYHYEVMANAVEIIQDSMSKGMRFANFVKYGYANVPVIGDYETGDDTVEVSLASFGAVAADYGKTLTSEQLKGSDEKYVSSDYIINATDCPLRDYTWFIANLTHSEFTCVANLSYIIFESDTQLTSDSIEQYPRFLQRASGVYDLVPLEAEAEPAAEGWSAFFNIIKRIIAAVTNAFTFLFSLLNKNDG